MPKQKNPEIEKQNFEVKKLLIGGLITLMVGLIGTGIWKYVDKKNNKEVLNTFLLTLNPLEGSTRKTLYMKMYSDMTGEATNEELTYDIKNILFQPNDKLVFTLTSEKWDLELDGFYNAKTNKYEGIVVGKKNNIEPIVSGWEAVIK